LEVFEAPSQIASALRDPLLQKYLQLGGSGDSERRLEFWLSRYLQDELENLREGFGLSATLSELLSAVVSFSESTKALPKAVEHFLRNYLPLWNGVSDAGAMLDLLAFLPQQPFQKLHRSVLSTLETSIFGGAETPCDILFDFYGRLAQRWMNTVQNDDNATHRATQAIFDLIEHVSCLAESALASPHSSHSAIIGFYERLTDLAVEQITTKKQLILPILPPRGLTYTIATTSSLGNFSRLCALLVTYKRCFEKQEAGVLRSHQANATDLLNGYLMDVCNMIWRSRALNTTDANAAGLTCPDKVTNGLQSYLTKVDRDYSVHTLFDFSHNALSATIAQDGFASIEEETQKRGSEEFSLHAGPVTQRSLAVLEKDGGVSLSWKQYRVEMLVWLESHGFDGMKRLLFATIKDLMKSN
jgi:centromere protein I